MFKRPLDTGQSFYALWWVARTSSVGCIVLFLTNLTTAALIWTLLPLKEIKPMLFSTQEKTNQVVTIEPLEKGTQGFTLMMEALSREYVALRETFDLQTEVFRWQKMVHFSSEALTEAFHQQMDEAQVDSPLKQFKDRKVTRSVTIMGSVHFGTVAPNIWQVDWVSIDRDPLTGTQTQSHWVSTLTVECQPKKVRLEDQYVNPLGFTVLQYSVNVKQPFKENT